MTDLSGYKGTFRITADENGKKKRFIVRADSSNNVEVLVFREVLEDRGHVFKSVGE